jgi:2-polyprenyl-3-methyl-5-hydroxy-6-metoxy-1,4-benzoquinol methylase
VRNSRRELIRRWARPALRTADFEAADSWLIRSSQYCVEMAVRLDFGPDHHYVRAYRQEEALYWAPVVSWIRNLKQVTSVLDIGPAYGTLMTLTQLTHAPERITSIDAVSFLPPSLAMTLGVEQLSGNIEVTEWPHLIGKFDLVIFTETIEHLNFHPRATLKRISDFLSPNGLMVISTPDAEGPWGATHRYYRALCEIPEPPLEFDQGNWVDGHVWQYSKTEILDVIRSAGLEVRAFAYSPGVLGRHMCAVVGRRGS